MNQEIEKYCRTEDEIDLYELVFIMLKNKKIIIMTTLLITLLSLGAAFYIRANTHVKYGVDLSYDYSIENNFYLKKAEIIPEITSVDSVLKNDDIIAKIFENTELENLYSKSVSKNANEISTRRKFLSEKIKINMNDKDKGLPIQNGTFEFDFSGNKKLSMEIGDLLFKLCNEEFIGQIHKKIDGRYNFVSNEKINATKTLEEIDLEIKNIMNKEFKNNYTNLNIEEIISIKYPKLFNDMKDIKIIYDKYNSQLMGLDGFLNDKNNKEILRKKSSYYEIETKSKAKLVLTIGIIIGLFLGIFLAFMKEFVDGYKKKYN